MSMKKKKKTQPNTLKREQRLKKARYWLTVYDGSERRIVRNYRKKFLVDIPTALQDLQKLGHVFAPGYVEAVMQGEKQRLLHKEMKKKVQFESDAEWSDDYFYFIAGHTSGGAPYGITWEEWV